MLAKRKSDGKQIEVREWRGASDVVYSSPDMTKFYEASALDFNIDTEDSVIQGWVARDEDENLFMYNTKPERDETTQMWMGGCINLDLRNHLFSDLTWDSDPIEVEITIKRKKK